MRFGKTAGAAATYVILASLQRSVSLLILPFVTHAMPLSEYGAASILASASLLITALVATPLVQLIIRAAARGGEDAPALLRASGLYCYYVVPAVAAAVAMGFALLVTEFLGVSGRIWAIEILAIGFQPSASTFALWVAQAREDLNRFATISTTSVLVAAASKLVFVVVLHLGVFGWAVSDLLSAVLTAVLASALVRLPRATITAPHMRYFLHFTLPLIPHSISLWALTFLSRPAMAIVTTLEQVGLFAFGLNIAQVAGLILAEANRAALPRYSRECLPAPTGETMGIVRWQIIGALLVPGIIGSGLALTGPWIFAEAYWPSFAITAILLLSQLAFGLYLVPMNYLTQSAGLPRYSSLASGAGAIVILLTIAIFGQRYGAFGVACGTVAAYAVMAVTAMWLTFTQHLPIAWRAWLSSWPEIGTASAGFACSILALSLPVGSKLSQSSAMACLAMMFVATRLTARRADA
ncbi:MAG: lipopolysaccharide biosynthesis protein [Actinomycetota bacterium]